MGISSDGLHFFGLCWNHEYDESDEDCERLPWIDEDDDPETALSAFLGGPKEPEWDPETRSFRGDRSAWRKERDAFLLDALGIELEFGIHCSYEYGMPYVAIKESHTRAWRGEAMRAKSGDEVAWAEALSRFAEVVGVEITDEIGPCWWVASLYG